MAGCRLQVAGCEGQNASLGLWGEDRKETFSGENAFIA